MVRVVLFQELLEEIRAKSDREMVIYGQRKGLNIKGQNPKDYLYYLSEKPFKPEQLSWAGLVIPHIPEQNIRGSLNEELLKRNRRTPGLDLFLIGKQGKDPLLLEVLEFESTREKSVVMSSYMSIDHYQIHPMTLKKIAEFYNPRIEHLKSRLK